MALHASLEHILKKKLDFVFHPLSATRIYKDFQPDWYISTVYHFRDAPFWSETLDILYSNYQSEREQ